MITSNDDAMILNIDKPSLLIQSHHHESSGYSSKEIECSSPENKTHIQHHEFKVKLATNNNSNHNTNSTTSSKTADIHRRRCKPPISPTTISNNGSLIIDDSLITSNNSEKSVRILIKKWFFRSSFY